ncbi:MAG: hypothetical protein RMK29_22175 [Myxococcales bacterium]|nr:hypothetical protein [Myxococcota bacterium]MDW8284423.1 hypothetical protein [Myxococcales bacterium]
MFDEQRQGAQAGAKLWGQSGRAAPSQAVPAVGGREGPTQGNDGQRPSADKVAGVMDHFAEPVQAKKEAGGGKAQAPAAKASEAGFAHPSVCAGIFDKPKGKMIGATRGGETLTVLSRADGWAHVKVDLNGVETAGYMPERYVIKQGEQGSIPVETISRYIADGPYGWDSQYDIWAVGKTVFVRLRIEAKPDAGVTQAEVDRLTREWEQAEQKWSGAYQLVDQADANNSYDVRVDVQFVTKGAHHTVRVRPGPARSNMASWDTKDDRHAASHEIGHMLGQRDEYPDPEAPDRTISDSSSVMHTKTGAVQKRHYQDFCDWLSKKTGKTFEVR